MGLESCGRAWRVHVRVRARGCNTRLIMLAPTGHRAASL